VPMAVPHLSWMLSASKSRDVDKQHADAYRDCQCCPASHHRSFVLKVTVIVVFTGTGSPLT
jgi:hypothetical protein